MLHSKEDRWQEDHLPEVHNEDALWGYAIRISEELRVRQPGDIRDNTLLRLLRMGIHDWSSPNNRSLGSAQAMRHSSALASRLLQRIMSFEEEVGPFPLAFKQREERLINFS